MGTTRNELFSETENELASVFKALGHPARVSILNYLQTKNSCVCGDIVSELPLSQSTVSQHLKELKKAGIIKGETEGSTVCYCIDGEKWNIYKSQIDKFFKFMIPMLEC